MRPSITVEPSEGVEPVEINGETRFGVTAKQLWRGAGLVALVVLSIAAVLPNLLPKKFTIATQTYVDESIENAKADAVDAMEQNTKSIQANTETVGAIKVTLEGVVEGQNRQIASTEADRVTQRIRNPDRRVREYERVRNRAIQNLEAGREPLDGVDLNF